MNILSIDYLRECFRYEYDSGILFWTERPRCHFSTEKGWLTFNGQFSGKEAGRINGSGYLRVSVRKKDLLNHRVIYALHHGEMPENEIDHINGVRIDNRISNLRSVTRQENAKNLKRFRNNKSGVSGVVWIKRREKWKATIWMNCKEFHLGWFSSFMSACEARIIAEIKMGYHKNHGRGLV